MGTEIKNCIVTGCARSGTSMMAGTLRENYFMGLGNYPPREANPKGFFEGSHLNGINNAILNRSTGVEGGDWWLLECPLDAQIVCPPNQAPEIRKLVSRAPFCLKDPRFCYCLPAWRPFLENTRYICMFRHPASTAKSLVYENIGRSIKSAMGIYISHYRHILEHQMHHGDWMFIHYDQLFQKKIIRKVELFLNAKADYGFPEIKYRKPVPDFIKPPDKAMDIYRELYNLAGLS